MPIEHELRALAKAYSEQLSKQIDARVAEMEEDDQSHFLIY
ncbi:MAG: ApaLI family restriction endonuclease, partial [Methyloprofundus sp.]|nr:ApaLI family restriction endonuclease [Methyloprofundus sp.]